MNKLKSGLMIAIMLVALVSTTAWQGCANTSANQTAYRAYGTTQVTAQGALQFWDAWLAANPVANQADKVVRQQQEMRVKALYVKWQAAMALVGDAGAAYASWGSNTNSAGNPALTALEVALTNAGNIKSDLVNVIQQITGKTIQG